MTVPIPQHAVGTVVNANLLYRDPLGGELVDLAGLHSGFGIVTAVSPTQITNYYYAFTLTGVRQYSRFDFRSTVTVWDVKTAQYIAGVYYPDGLLLSGKDVGFVVAHAQAWDANTPNDELAALKRELEAEK